MAVKDWTFRQLAAEFMAMILFVWIGTGSAVSSGMWTPGGDPARLLTIATAFGVGIAVLAYGIGHISGGHINPAVTLAFMLLGDISIVKGILYMVVQFTGAIVGSLIVWGCAAGLADGCDDSSQEPVCLNSRFGDQWGPAFTLGLNTVSSTTSIGSAFLLELVGTYLLVITVLNSAVDKNSGAGSCAPIAIGWSVMLAHINLVPFTGCGINPARTFGPMIVDSIAGIGGQVWIRGWWVYYVAPFVGSAFAALTYKFILASPDVSPVEQEGGDEEAKA
jgi:MIP family channel proteins